MALVANPNDNLYDRPNDQIFFKIKMKKKQTKKKKTSKQKNKKDNKKELYYQRMLYGLFCMFPIMFFKSAVVNTIFFDVFGILSLIGLVVMIYNFVKRIKVGK